MGIIKLLDSALSSKLPLYQTCWSPKSVKFAVLTCIKQVTPQTKQQERIEKHKEKSKKWSKQQAKTPTWKNKRVTRTRRPLLNIWTQVAPMRAAPREEKLTLTGSGREACNVLTTLTMETNE